MIVLDERQRSALEASLGGLVILTGPPGSGKTTALLRRAAAAIAARPELPLARYVVTSTAPGAGTLRAQLRAHLDPARQAELDAVPWLGGDLATVAHAILAENALAARLALDLALIDDDEAEAAFERAGAALFALEWTEFVTAEIDPELAGLRAPERFAAAALRLFRKLRAALIGPEEFLSCALRGAISFYATPPNFANPDLLQATREEYRDSLDVDRAELERQRLREVDLAKVLARLYSSYLDELVAAGCLTAIDAIAEATRLLRERPDLARRYRAEFVAAFVDDAQDLTAGALGLLGALFGDELAGVTLAGDRDQATQTFAGARPERVFALPATTIALEGSYRVPPAIAASARALLGKRAEPLDLPGHVRLMRARTPADEARLIAAEIRDLVAGGAAPGAIALVVRSFVWMRPYRDALVDAGIPVSLAGPIDLYDEPDVEDALALLWATCDPFRHDRLLRALGTAAVALNDLGLYVLCGEPSDPQTALFELPDDGDSVRGRWDRRRNLRLALNVVRGDRDADLEPPTRARVVAFRERLAGWRGLVASLAPEDAAAAIVEEGGLREPLPGETASRSRLRDDLLDALLRRIAAYAAGARRRSLRDFLQFAERTGLGDRPRFERIGDDGVAIASIDALKGAEFAHVFVCNLRAGAFPAYYAPDAFLFSPSYGVIPKDNVGDAETTRTAKFTWYLHHAKLKERYAREDRHALYCALTRARESVTLSASGRPTRGIGAPELLVELQQARLPYVRDVGVGRVAAGARLEVATAAARTPRVARADDAPPSSLTVAIADLAAARVCGRCARRAFLVRRAAPETPPAPKPPAGATIVAADVPFALRFARGLVADRLPWILDLKGTRIACVPAAESADLWLLAAATLGMRDDAVVVATGSLSPRRAQAPQIEEIEAWLESFAAGETVRLCAECRDAVG